MLLRDLSASPQVQHASAGTKEIARKSGQPALISAGTGSLRHGPREGRGGWQAADGCSAFVSSLCTPDIIRNLKVKNASLLKEKNEVNRSLEALQTSMRATRMGEMEKENHVLITEVARLRQMNELLHKKMIAKQQAADTHVIGLQSKVAELKLELRRCICIPDVSMQCASTRNPTDTLADLRSRSRTAHVALEHTVSCCKHLLCSEVIQADSHTNRAAVEVLEAIARKHSMINDELGSLTNRSSPVNEDRLLNKQSLARPRRLQAPRNRAGIETKSLQQLTKKHVDDVRRTMMLLICDLRNMRTVQFASDSELQQQTRVVGKLVTEFVQRHMELDPVVQRQFRVKPDVDVCVGTAMHIQTGHHARNDDMIPRDGGHSLDAARIDIDKRGDGVAVSARRVLNVDCSMQPPAHTPATPYASGIVRGFFGKASLQAWPDSSSLQMDPILSLELPTECDMPSNASNVRHVARGAEQCSYACEHNSDVWHGEKSLSPGGIGPREPKSAREAAQHPPVSEFMHNGAPSGSPQVGHAGSAIEKDITQARASNSAVALCNNAEQHQGQHTLGTPESEQPSIDVVISSHSSRDVFSEVPGESDDSAAGLGLDTNRESAHCMATEEQSVIGKSASSRCGSSHDSDTTSGHSYDSITSCTPGKRTHSSCNSADSLSNNSGNGCRSASAVSRASGHTDSAHEPAQNHTSMDWKADTCAPLHDVRDSEKGKAIENVCGQCQLSTPNTFMGSSLASSTAQADEIAAVLDEICDEIEGSTSVHDII